MKIFFSTFLATLAALSASAQSMGQTAGAAGPQATPRAPQVVELWPEGVPDLRKDASDERLVNGRVVNVHRPTLTVFAPERGKSNGTAVIFCPGGGYVRLAVGSPSAGPPEARWLVERGATVFVLRYRLAEYGHPAPLRDVLRAVRVVRSRAAEFGVRADRVGLLGLSAGGHLAASAAARFDAPEGRTGSPLDAVSARPDFVALIYPVVTMEDPFAHKGSREALLGAKPTPEMIEGLSLEKHARKEMPPVFLAATGADQSVPVENTLLLYQALRRAGVPAEMHVYAAGAHGDSLDPQYGPTALWPLRCAEWMRFNGWLPKSD
jgi:acetyl esterase/lipase